MESKGRAKEAFIQEALRRGSESLWKLAVEAGRLGERQQGGSWRELRCFASLWHVGPELPAEEGLPVAPRGPAHGDPFLGAGGLVAGGGSTSRAQPGPVRGSSCCVASCARPTARPLGCTVCGSQEGLRASWESQGSGGDPASGAVAPRPGALGGLRVVREPWDPQASKREGALDVEVVNSVGSWT